MEKQPERLLWSPDRLAKIFKTEKRVSHGKLKKSFTYFIWYFIIRGFQHGLHPMSWSKIHFDLLFTKKPLKQQLHLVKSKSPDTNRIHFIHKLFYLLLFEKKQQTNYSISTTIMNLQKHDKTLLSAEIFCSVFKSLLCWAIRCQPLAKTKH